MGVEMMVMTRQAKAAVSSTVNGVAGRSILAGGGRGEEARRERGSC